MNKLHVQFLLIAQKFNHTNEEVKEMIKERLIKSKVIKKSLAELDIGQASDLISQLEDYYLSG